MSQRSRNFIYLGIMVLMLSGCIPTIVIQPSVQAPRFALNGSVEIIDFQPPLIGSGNVVMQLPISVFNPNPVALSLQSIDFDFFVNGQQALHSSFDRPLQLNAQGSSSFVLIVSIPLLSGLALIDDIIAMIDGQSTSFRLDGSVSVEINQYIEVFTRTTLLSGRIN